MIIFIVTYFILSRQKEIAQPQVSATVAAFRNTLTENKSAPSEDAKAPPSAPAAAPAEQALEDRCWEKLSAQVKEDDFALQNRMALQEVVSDWYFFRDASETPPSESSPSDLFLRALLEAGFLDGKMLHQGNEAYALELLAKVHEADPNNSAPLIYAAMIENRRGNEAAAKRLFASAKETRRFDTYITTVSRTIFSQVKNSSDLVQAYALWSRLPVPSYYDLSTYLRNQDSHFVAEQMMRQGLDDKNILPDIDWFVLEYATGLSIENKLNPDNKFPRYREIMDKKSKLNPFAYEKVLAALKKNCDLSSLDEFVAEFQRYLEKPQ